MTTKIFVNMAVNDLARSTDFFTKIGFSFNSQFTGDDCACMVIAENIYAMLLVKERFGDFTKKPICDARNATEMLLAIDVDSREAVDTMVKRAAAAGGIIYAGIQDHGWMYGHSFADPDGHQWEVLYIDESLAPN